MIKISRYISKYCIFTAICFGAFFVSALSVHAASIYFDPQDTTVGTSTDFEVGIKIDAFTPINAMDLVINIPPTMKVVDVSDGNSIINMWVEQPHITDAGKLAFSGIVPGGYTGIGGSILTLKMRAASVGVQSLFIDRISRVYRNSSTGVPDMLASIPLVLSVVAGRDNISNMIPDTHSPEQFVPQIAYLDRTSQPRYVVLFQAQDKQSGIDHYEVSETSRKVDVSDTTALERLDWVRAESPHTLQDQTRSSFVCVRAVDKKGNIRVECIAPVHGSVWMKNAIQDILIVLVALIIFYVIVTRIKISRR